MFRTPAPFPHIGEECAIARLVVRSQEIRRRNLFTEVGGHGVEDDLEVFEEYVAAFVYA